MQSLQCKVCQKVTLADGSQVWVCKECGEEHQAGEGAAIDQSMQAEVTAAAAQVPTPPVQPAAPVAAPVATTNTEPVVAPTSTPSDQPAQ